jgi:SAM-dependent methyltransferase
MSSFDPYSDSYQRVVDQSISFIGQTSDFFTKLKAHELLDVMRRCAGEPSLLNVLDVGCGIGGTDSYLLPYVRRLVGVDVSRAMLDKAAAANPGAAYEVCDGETLPFDDGSFDFSFSICVVHHVPPPNRPRFVRELVRVTRRGGVVAIAEHNPFNPLTRLVVMRCVFDDDAVLLRMREAARLLEAANARVVDRRYIAFVPLRGTAFRKIERSFRRIMLGAQYIITGEAS